jgi:hypothetical protein
MKVFVTVVAATALLFGSSAASLAKGGGPMKGHAGGKAHFSKSHFGAKTRVSARGNVHAPGQQMKLHGSVAGHPGASGYAPGHLMQENGSVTGHAGASGYAPGHLRETSGSHVRVR